MKQIFRTSTALLSTILLMFTMSAAHAALVSYTITGDVVSGDEFAPNVFGLTAGDTITASGVFDDSVLTGSGDGAIDFSTGTGNTMTINVGTETFTNEYDVDFWSGSGPSIDLVNFDLVDFDYLAFAGTNGAPADFSSFFTSFDDLDSLFGDWRTEVELAVVPVPAAIWLFGSGLLALAGVLRRRTV